MVCNRCEHKDLYIKIDNENIQEINEFCYLKSNNPKKQQKRKEYKKSNKSNQNNVLAKKVIFFDQK